MSHLHRVALPSLAVRRRLAPAALLLTATFALGACTASGGNDFTGQAAEVADVVEDFSERARRDDAAGICKRSLDPALAKQLASSADGDCTKAMQRAIDNADYTGLRVGDVELTPRTNATSAVATIETANEGRIHELAFKLNGRQWQIAKLSLSGK